MPIGLAGEGIVYHKCNGCNSKELWPCQRIVLDEEEEDYYYKCKGCIDAEFSMFNGKYSSADQWKDAHKKEKEKQRLEQEADDILSSERQLTERLRHENNSFLASKDTISKLERELAEVKEKKRKFAAAPDHHHQ